MTSKSAAAAAFEEDAIRPKIVTLAVTDIVEDPEIASREIDPDLVSEYAEAMATGDTFPPLEVMKDDAVYWLVGGAHRLAAARSSGLDSVRCEVREGDRRAALLASTAVNARHGLRRSADDKRRATLKLLRDKEWRQWSDRQIAKQCRVSNTFVSQLRAELTVNVDSDNHNRRYVTKHGNVADMNVANIGANQATVNYLARKIIRDDGYVKAPHSPCFDGRDMAQLEELVEYARYANKALAPRLKTAAAKLAKVARTYLKIV